VEKLDMKVYEHLDLLGKEVADKVTGLVGIATSICFDLYGCIQALVTPVMDKDGKLGDPNWFDVNRLVIKDTTPVMERPDYMKGFYADGKSGAAEKPVQCKLPLPR